MQPDTELERWRRDWQNIDVPPPDLRKRIEREEWRTKLSFASSLVVTILFGVGMPLKALSSRQSDDLVLAVAVWIFIISNWAVSLRLGLYPFERPTAMTASAFIDASIANCVKRQRTIVAAVVLYFLFLVFMLIWEYSLHSGIEIAGFRSVISANVSVWIVALGVVIVAALRYRFLKRELSNLTVLRDQCEPLVGREMVQ